VLVVVGIVIAGVAVDKLWVVGEGDIVVAVEVVGGIVEVVTGHLGVDVVGTRVEVVVVVEVVAAIVDVDTGHLGVEVVEVLVEVVVAVEVVGALVVSSTCGRAI